MAEPVRWRAVLFEEEHADDVVARLRAEGFEAVLERERLAGEDDEEDHPWAVVTDAPEIVVELLVERYDGWLDVADPPPPPAAASLPLPDEPRRHHRAP